MAGCAAVLLTGNSGRPGAGVGVRALVCSVHSFDVRETRGTRALENFGIGPWVNRGGAGNN